MVCDQIVYGVNFLHRKRWRKNLAFQYSSNASGCGPDVRTTPTDPIGH